MSQAEHDVTPGDATESMHEHAEPTVRSVEDLVSASRAYLVQQREAGAVLSPAVGSTSPGSVLSRALAGVEKIQRI